MLSGSLDMGCNGMRDCELDKGTVVFLPAEREVKLYPKCEEEVLVFQAYCSR